MTFKNPINPSGAQCTGKRRIDFKAGIALGLIALVTWLTNRNGGGSGCVAGTCLKAALTQPGIPLTEDAAK